jgi:hypothetical protein
MTTAAAVSGTELVRLEEPLLSPDEQAAQGRPSRVSCPRSPPRGPHRDLLNELETRIHDDGRCATDLPVRTVALAIPKRRTVNVHALLATAVSAEGYREILGLHVTSTGQPAMRDRALLLANDRSRSS